VPDFMAALRDREGLGARALEIAILTAMRTGEIIGAKWTELDLAAKVWTIPAGRMKGAREHRVPLSARVLEILAELPRTDPHVLFDRGLGKPIPKDRMLDTLRQMDGPSNVTVHGFRSTFRDWAAETTAYPNHVVEMALAHAISDQVEAAYRRGDLFEKRRRLMNEWEKYCGRGGAGAGTTEIVTVLRSAGVG
jgi:integrase